MNMHFIVNGNWGPWTNQGSCSKKCGPGTQKRKRACNNPNPSAGGKSCPGPKAGTVKCNLKPCPGMLLIMNSIYSHFEDWEFYVSILFPSQRQLVSLEQCWHLLQDLWGRSSNQTANLHQSKTSSRGQVLPWCGIRQEEMQYPEMQR